MTGLISKDFWTIKPAVKKVKLGAGLFGVSVKNVNDYEGAYYINQTIFIVFQRLMEHNEKGLLQNTSP